MDQEELAPGDGWISDDSSFYGTYPFLMPLAYTIGTICRTLITACISPEYTDNRL
jgi:hypothetical protein